MIALSALLENNASNAWIFVPSAVLLGALHGLEPGHSKTMMAAFIVSVRGTVSQAILLGLSATLSHTMIVWLVALIGLHFGAQWNTQTIEPALQLASSVIMIGLALWMSARTWLDLHRHSHASHPEAFSPSSPHHHAHEMDVTTALGKMSFDLIQEESSHYFRIVQKSAKSFLNEDKVMVEVLRPDGTRDIFGFLNRQTHFRSDEPVKAPIEFVATLRIVVADKVHEYSKQFPVLAHQHHQEKSDHSDHEHETAHEKFHAEDIRKRFDGREVTTGQIVIFGLTGGLIPCPAAVTVLILCLQIKRFALGLSLVLCFSVGLAATMVMSGVVAAVSVHHVRKKWKGFSRYARLSPYFSSALIFIMGLVIGYSGLRSIVHL